MPLSYHNGVHPLLMDVNLQFLQAAGSLHTYIYTYIHTYIHYITLHYITLHYITLHNITLHYITLHYITYTYIPATFAMLQVPKDWGILCRASRLLGSSPGWRQLFLNTPRLQALITTLNSFETGNMGHMRKDTGQWLWQPAATLVECFVYCYYFMQVLDQTTHS